MHYCNNTLCLNSFGREGGSKSLRMAGKIQGIQRGFGRLYQRPFYGELSEQGFFSGCQKGREVVGYLLAEKLRARGAVIWYLGD